MKKKFLLIIVTGTVFIGAATAQDVSLDNRDLYLSNTIYDFKIKCGNYSDKGTCSNLIAYVRATSNGPKDRRFPSQRDNPDVFKRFSAVKCDKMDDLLKQMKLDHKNEIKKIKPTYQADNKYLFESTKKLWSKAQSSKEHARNNYSGYDKIEATLATPFTSVVDIAKLPFVGTQNLVKTRKNKKLVQSSYLELLNKLENFVRNSNLDNESVIYLNRNLPIHNVLTSLNCE